MKRPFAQSLWNMPIEARVLGRTTVMQNSHCVENDCDGELERAFSDWSSI